VERYNRTLRNQVRAFCEEHSGEWDSILFALILAYNTCPHMATGMAPFELLTPHRMPRLTVEGPVGSSPLATDDGSCEAGSTVCGCVEVPSWRWRETQGGSLIRPSPPHALSTRKHPHFQQAYTHHAPPRAESARATSTRAHSPSKSRPCTSLIFRSSSPKGCPQNQVHAIPSNTISKYRTNCKVTSRQSTERHGITEQCSALHLIACVIFDVVMTNPIGDAADPIRPDRAHSSTAMKGRMRRTMEAQVRQLGSAALGPLQLRHVNAAQDGADADRVAERREGGRR